MKKVIIMGAGGRDFHNFNVAFRNDPRHRSRRVHGDADPRHRRSHLPAGAGRAALPRGDSDPPRRGADATRPEPRRRRGHPRLLRPQARDGDAQGIDRARGGRRLPAHGPGYDDAPLDEAGRRGLRDADGLRQEPDEPQGRAGARRRGPQGRARAPSDAVRRPRGDARPALRDARGDRRVASDRRGARGVRGAGAAGHGHVRRRRLRGDPPAGRAGGRRRRLGRRQQRLPVLRTRPPDRRRRPAAARARAAVPPG